MAFEENEKGSLEVGKLGDFVVLEHDPFRASPEQIKDIPVRMTVVGGEMVYDAQHRRKEVICRESMSFRGTSARDEPTLSA
jgi:hypothetical protein